ncbi:MAG: hypothetical protein Q4P84_08640, partial [Elusimicrobiales bacterium]|nr:hypothetical protein [Elusimicrobiales bacterium]
EDGEYLVFFERPPIPAEGFPGDYGYARYYYPDTGTWGQGHYRHTWDEIRQMMKGRRACIWADPAFRGNANYGW